MWGLEAQIDHSLDSTWIAVSSLAAVSQSPWKIVETPMLLTTTASQDTDVSIALVTASTDIEVKQVRSTVSRQFESGTSGHTAHFRLR